MDFIKFLAVLMAGSVAGGLVLAALMESSAPAWAVIASFAAIVAVTVMALVAIDRHSRRP